MATTTDRRILEYALKGLEAERDLILAEVEELRARLADAIAPESRRHARRAGKKAKKRRARAVKGLKRQAARKASAVKKKARKMTAAQKKALSKKMKAAWARRKEAAKK